MSEEDNRSHVIGPLSFTENKQICSGYLETQCMLCEDKFNLELSLHIFLKHLFEVHHIVVEDAQNVENLHRYVDYWKERFKNTNIENIIPAVSIDSGDCKYFVLSTLLQEDKQLRHKLRLEKVLNVQEDERTNDNFKRQCLFCKLHVEGLRAHYINHLSEQHNFQLGNPQNLVFIDELIDKLEEKLKSLQCIYCEKTFPDWSTMKEHMRKKSHKCINPNNTTYDKHYSINYLEPDRNWHSLEKETDNLPIMCNSNSDEEYGDWEEQSDCIVCLYCSFRDMDVNVLFQHMNETHAFDFLASTRNMDFYQKVKLVNYIRRQIHKLRCAYCDVACTNKMDLGKHMKENKHYELPEIKVFDQPEYYFPTYENDALLYFLEDKEDVQE